MVVGVSGASGAPIAQRVLDGLAAASVPVHLVVSNGARAVIQEELAGTPEALARLASATHSDGDLSAPISSGSFRTRGMVVVPCSSNTAAKIALGLADTLLTRAAHVHLKEHRRLVVVPRETPMDAILLRHLSTLAELGVVILVASPPYYLHARTVEEQTDYLAGKILDQFEVPHHLYKGWKEGAGT
ncbi:MAG: UbiX family flavin prenyltransferase [Thermoplasmata archaeon]|nr:UbiX family flavin prenyltransferase [Thermoplasmata archaeon]